MANLYILDTWAASNGWFFRPQFLLVQSLQHIVYNKFGHQIISAHKREPGQNKDAVRNVCSQLPLTVRAQLLQTTLNIIQEEHLDDLEEYPVSLFVAEVLFADHFTGLQLTFTKEFDLQCLNGLLKLLTETGREVVRLRFFFENQNSRLEDITHLREVLNGSNLCELCLTRICDDDIMKLVGETCENLQYFNAQNSHVTNRGLHFLTQTLEKLPYEVCWVKTDWDSTVWGVPNVFPPLKELLPPGESAKCYKRKKRAICSTLRVLDLTMCTDIDYTGIIAVLELVPNLKSFGLKDLEPFFRNFRQARIDAGMEINGTGLPKLSLEDLKINKIDTEIFNLVESMCPKINNLVARTFDILSLLSLPLATFNTLPLLKGIIIEEYQSTYHDTDIWTLSPNLRSRLTDLMFSNDEEIFNLKLILKACPNLHHLVSCTYFEWTNVGLIGDSQRYFSLEYLTIMTLYSGITGKCLLNVIKCAPNLEIFMAMNLEDKPRDLLQKLCAIRASPSIKQFCIWLGNFLENEEQLNYFLQHYKKISHIGRLEFKPTQLSGKNEKKFIIKVPLAY